MRSLLNRILDPTIVFSFDRTSCVTEGRLRALHRASDDSKAPYRQKTPWQSCRRDDASELVPGEVAVLDIGLLPTS